MTIKKPSRRQFLTMVGSAGLGGSACLADAFLVEPDWLSFTDKEIPLPNLPASLDGLHVIHLADFHFRPGSDDALLAELVQKVNALDADLIVLTGDYVIHDTRVIHPLLSYLGKMRARHGIIASMGNHDGWADSGSFFKRAFEKAGITFLINENTQLTLRGQNLAIAGLDFIWSGHPDANRAFRSIQANTPTLALVHEPDYFDFLSQEKNVLLQLSGHTHGGQCRVPLIGYAPAKVRYGKKYIYGLYGAEDEEKGAKLHVTRGIGTTGIRVRFACRPELALLTLRSE